MMESIPIKIGNEQEVIRQLFSLYGGRDPTEALKEYISNAVDARRSGKPVCVYITLDRNNGEIVVADNGVGMPYEKLKMLPQSLGESSSKGDINKRGEKALGLLAFGNLGDRAMIVSRNGSDQYGALYLDAVKFRANAEKMDYPAVRRLFDTVFDQGTIVRINGIQKKDFDQYFQPERLRASMQDIYDPLVRRGELQIYIKSHGEKDKHIEVQPVQRSGIITLERITQTTEPIIKTEKGNVHGTTYANIWLDPNASNAKVATYNKGVRVLSSVTQLREFNHFPWNSGKLSGFIDENFCVLTPQRESYMRDTENRGDKKFATLGQIITSLEPELSKKVREAEKQAKSAQTVVAIQALEEALAQTYADCPPPWKPLKPTNGEIIKCKFETEKPEREENTVKPSTTKKKITKPTGTPLRTPYPIDIVEFTLNKQEQYSEFDHTYKKILINKAHPEYDRFAQDPKSEEHWIYFAKLVSSEAALGDYLLSRDGNDVMKVDQSDISKRATTLFLKMFERLNISKKRR